MKIAVVGSRGVKAFDLGRYLEGATTIVSGGAKGVDTLAEEYAKTNGIKAEIYRPDFSQGYHPRKFLERNKLIVDAAEKVVAVWDGKSRGTKFTIDYALRRGKAVEIIYA